MTPLVYLHGLNSSGASAKATRLREAFGADAVFSPTYRAHRPHEAVATLRERLSDLDLADSVVVGSSMGGFYGRYLAQELDFGHLLLINPALRPWELLPQHLGEQTVSATGERYRLTSELTEATRQYGVEPAADRTPTTVLLDAGDEVIDYRIAAEIYRGRADVRVYPDGNHAFAHMPEGIALIRDILRLADGS